MNRDILTFDVAQGLQARAERIHEMLGLSGRAGAEKADQGHRRLLRAHHARPNGRRAN
jgi:hypothetical protein